MVSCTRSCVHAEIRGHKQVTMGANLHRLNDFVLTICFGSKQRRAKKRNIAESDFLMQLAL